MKRVEGAPRSARKQDSPARCVSRRRRRLVGAGALAAIAATWRPGTAAPTVEPEPTLCRSVSRHAAEVVPRKEDLAAVLRRDQAEPSRLPPPALKAHSPSVPRHREAEFLRFPGVGVLPASSPDPDREFDTIPYYFLNRPDSAVAAGPSHLVTSVNFGLQVQDLDGTDPLLLTLSSFFPDDPTRSIGDPRLSYDQAADRFILAALGFDYPGHRSWCDVAVSATPDPRGVWYKYSFDVARGGPPVTDQMDYDSLGYDGAAIYVAARTRNFDTIAVTGNRMVILDRAKALAGEPLSPVIVDDLELPGAPGVAAEVVKPVEPAGAVGPSSPGYLLCTAGASELALYTVTDPLGGAGGPFITGIRIPVPASVPAGDAPQPGGPPVLRQTAGSPLHKTTIRDGVIWSCQSPSATGLTGDRSGVVVYKIDPVSGTLLETHSISDPSLWYYLPAVVPDVSGNAVAVFAGSDASQYASIYHARYDASMAAFEAPVLTEAGASSFGPRDPLSYEAWGDYLDAAPDVASGARKVWVHGELPVTRATWKMRAARIPSTPAVCDLLRASVPSLAPPIDKAGRLYPETCATTSCPDVAPEAAPARPPWLASFTEAPDADIEALTGGDALVVYEVDCCCAGTLLVGKRGAQARAVWTR